MIADTGAKNGVWWPSTSVAMSQDTPAATAAWKIERHASRRRSSRVRIETRERSAASSISGAARSDSGDRRASTADDPGTEAGNVVEIAYLYLYLNVRYGRMGS